MNKTKYDEPELGALDSVKLSLEPRITLDNFASEPNRP